MTKFIPIGRVQGEDGKIAQVNTVYVNDGGDPDVLAEISGESTNATLTLTFKNLVRDQLTESELDQIINNITVTSSNVVTGTRLSKFWERLWAKLNEKFAKAAHTHDAGDIEDGAITTDKIATKAITTAKIADGAVGETQLEQSLRNSIFPLLDKTPSYIMGDALHFVLRRDSDNEIYLRYSNQTKDLRVDVKYNGEFKGQKSIASW